MVGAVSERAANPHWHGRNSRLNLFEICCSPQGEDKKWVELPVLDMCFVSRVTDEAVFVSVPQSDSSSSTMRPTGNC